MASATTGNLTDRARALLGYEVRAARIRAGLPRIDDLAEASGVSRKTIGKLEGGQPVAERSIVALEPYLGWAANEWLRKVEQAVAADNGDVSIATDPSFVDFRAKSAGGSDGDAMRLFGWRSMDMVNRYGAKLADERARDAARRLGIDDF